MSYFEGQFIKLYDCDNFIDLLAKCMKIIIEEKYRDEKIPDLIYFNKVGLFYEMDILNQLKHSYDLFTNDKIESLNLTHFIKDILEYGKFFQKKRSVKFRKSIVNRIYKDSKKQIKIKCKNSNSTINSIFLFKAIIITLFLSYPKNKIPQKKFESHILENANSYEKTKIVEYYTLNGSYYELVTKLSNNEKRKLQYLLILVEHKIKENEQ